MIAIAPARLAISNRRTRNATVSKTILSAATNANPSLGARSHTEPPTSSDARRPPEGYARPVMTAPPRLRTVSLESRRSGELARLLERHGLQAIAAPSLREVPIEDQREAFA